jgi:hypothetical protein
MEQDWASENLLIIRTLMERSAVYRHALAPVMSLVGFTGIIAGAVGAGLGFETSRFFAAYWTGIAIVCMVEAFLLIRRQAVKEVEPFWSPPARRVVRAILPAFFAGLAVAVVFFCMDLTVREQVVLIIPIWMVIYGLGMHSAGFFMPRGFRWFGWGFIVCGLAGAGYWARLSATDTRLPDFPVANTAMAVLFGGAHTAYGIYLYFTEKRQPVV